MRARAAASGLVLLTVLLLCGQASSEPGSAGSTDEETAPDAGEEALPVDDASLSTAELHQLCLALDEGEAEPRQLAAERIVAAAPRSVETIRQRLTREMRSAPADLLAVMDRHARDEPGRILPPRRDTSVDFLAELLAADWPDDQGERRALAEVSEVVALLRALTDTGTTSAASIVIRYGVRERGVFKAEIGRNLVRLGDRAIPALVRTERHPSEAIASFATEALTWLGRMTAGQQVQIRDPAVLAEILAIYGENGDRSSIPVLLSFSGSEHREVRDAARTALRRYERAILWPARTKYENFIGTDPPRAWGWEKLAQELFRAQDDARLAQAERGMEKGLAFAEKGEHAKMLESYNHILGRWPLYERRSEMVPGLLTYADELEKAGKGRQARTLLARASLLEADQAKVSALAARLALIDAETAFARGIADPEAVERILVKIPDSRQAEELRDRIRARTDRPPPRVYRIVATVGLGVFGLGVLGLLVIRMLPAGTLPKEGARALKRPTGEPHEEPEGTPEPPPGAESDRSSPPPDAPS